MTAAEVLGQIEKDAIFYEESGGGVTFSGGEPLSQPDFLRTLLEACSAENIHTAVETCGMAKQETLLEITPYVGLFLYDLKIVDNQEHRRFTGVSNTPILENLKALSEHHPHVVIRFPLIPGINDDHEALVQIAQFASSLRNAQEIQILAYHKAGIEKYKGLGKTYELLNIVSPSSDQISQTADRFRSYGLRVQIGG